MAGSVFLKGLRAVGIAAVAAFVMVSGPGLRDAAAYQVNLSNEELSKLDTFEAHTLSQADVTFGKNKFREALKEYDAFIVEFPKSKLVPYAVLRKGRCLHLDSKRYQAIREYEEILDYFPNSIKYAAAALYYIGQAHSQNGELDKAMKAWAEMAQDEDYRTHYLAGFAINALAGNLMKQEKVDDAVRYYDRVCVDFKGVNRDARWAAIGNVIYHHIRRNANEKKLRDFYVRAGTFEHSSRKAPEDQEKDGLYWQRVHQKVWAYGSFNNLQADAKKKYYKYWGDRLEGRFPEWDDYQINYINIRYAHEEDRTLWGKRLDAQFEKYQKEGNWDRIMQWIKMYKAFPQKVDQYFQKITVEKMTNAEIQRLAFLFYDQVGNKELGRNLLLRLRYDEMKDSEHAGLARSVWGRDTEFVEPSIARMEDQEWGKMETLEFFFWGKQHGRLSASQLKRCHPLAVEVTKVDRYAKRAWWIKAEFHSWDGQFKEAIAAYRMSDNPSLNLWKIVDCFLALRKPKEAIVQLKEIETFFKGESSRAALRIAHVYRDSGDKPKYVSSLRGVLKKYPESGESSTAHQEMEAMGYKISRYIGGGEDAD
ncbi:MAG: tetratricopeptide repeat protein [Lentisphaerae bacterium]|nr:tetratricopeptide repeat protein [Lentisphaerota bacterium]